MTEKVYISVNVLGALKEAVEKATPDSDFYEGCPLLELANDEEFVQKEERDHVDGE